ncbi:hypothetical protein Terro_3924 [Terriglobus roseus DSM 18391]|uniref:Uncharacterized protein n=1 Tax=Terriglobus roseus (strain DSM 18391 / NRRL B-41598 / KBS 63) TaxID=926566 RepID=I3ZLL4_TERRK|nr:hypothetical protein Terro_3924 [Terriglobus roseus DSM 18391]
MTTYEWDEAKAEKNLRKHEVSFDDAREALEDPNLFYLPDRIYEGELRHQAIGQAGGVLLLMVAHTLRGDDEQTRVRIISARPAERREQRLYRDSASRSTNY